ncbi:MAG: sugar ABC transporter permease [Clostridia bacterium]|nr:sugar ABC transporter permease [Clostridia bacterium]
MESNLRTTKKRFMDRYDDFPKPLRRHKYLFIVLMLSLSIISWAVFYVYVNFSSFAMAFQKFVGYGENNEEIYVWSLDNFRRFWQEMTYKGYAVKQFKAALKNTLFLFVAGNIVVMPMAFLVSYVLYKKIHGEKVFKVLLYLPSILSTVVMVTIFKNIVEVHGLISSISQKLTGKAVTVLLHDDHWAKWTVWAYNTWVGFCGGYILLTAAMSRIPEEIVESAKLDGIGAWTEFWKIIIPMIWPTVHILLLQKITGFLAADGPILLLTGGGADTYTIGYWYYDQVIVSHSFEYPSAVGLILTAFLAPIAIIARKLLDKVYADVEF